MSSNAEDSLEALIVDVLALSAQFHYGTARPGDLVFCPMSLLRDRDAIGWLVAHDEVFYFETEMFADGLEGPQPDVREVWDIRPISGARGAWGAPQRWENADFYPLPAEFAERARKLEANGE